MAQSSRAWSRERKDYARVSSMGRDLETVDCRGCGAEFRTHQVNRAYCSGACRMAARGARILSEPCVECGELFAFQPGEIIGTTPDGRPVAYRVSDARRRAYVDQHAACRRRQIEAQGIVRQCVCQRCKTERGEPPRQRKPRAAATVRDVGYRKHFDEVFARDGGICQICGILVDAAARPSDDKFPTLDHLVQVAFGGDTDPGVDGLRLAHKWCNIKAYTWDDATVRAEAIDLFTPNS